MWEQRFLKARVYRRGRLVCAQARVAIVGDGRLGMTAWESRRHVCVQFQDGIDPVLRAELHRLAGARGAKAARIADRLDPVEVVVEDHRRELRLEGRLERPVVGGYREIDRMDFRVREQGPSPTR
jgi:hypothetical protein